MQIDAPDFEIDHKLQVLTLQGEWGVRRADGPEDGRFVVDDPNRAHETCIRLVRQVRANEAQVALVPELPIPKRTLPDAIAMAEEPPSSLVFLGRIEGLTLQEYTSLLGHVGDAQPLAQLMNPIMDALGAHNTMSTQALESERVRSGLRNVLFGPAQLYEALPERSGAGLS
jgi:hypothetical protein